MKTESSAAPLVPGRSSDAKTATGTRGFAQRYFAFIARHRLKIIGTWFLIVVLGFAFGLKFLQHTTQDFNPASNTASMQAHKSMELRLDALVNGKKTRPELLVARAIKKIPISYIENCVDHVMKAWELPSYEEAINYDMKSK